MMRDPANHPGYDTAFRNRVLALLEQPPPPGMSLWNGPAAAERPGSSVYSVACPAPRRHPSAAAAQLVREHGSEFAPKAADIVGLYLDPPLNAVVLSVDEKPSMQAIERSSGYIETDNGDVVRGLKSTYKWHGTLNLFAALEVGTGQVRTKIIESRKRADFQSFLGGDRGATEGQRNSRDPR